MGSKEIGKMSRDELLNLVADLINGNNLHTPINKVGIGDVEVVSSRESLARCKKIANDLVKENIKFITLRKAKLKADEWGYFG